MDDKPFPAPKPPGSEPTTEWAIATLNLWKERGYPDLIGSPAEQVKVAEEIIRKSSEQFRVLLNGEA